MDNCTTPMQDIVLLKDKQCFNIYFLLVYIIFVRYFLDFTCKEKFVYYDLINFISNDWYL